MLLRCYTVLFLYPHVFSMLCLEMSWLCGAVNYLNSWVAIGHIFDLRCDVAELMNWPWLLICLPQHRTLR
jgi:hypothetical protein